MENLIDQIVKMDQQAQKITDLAQKEKLQATNDVARRREEIRDAYLKEARERLHKNEPQERKLAEEKWKVTEQKQAVLREKMEDVYHQNYDGWVQKLVSRVLEG